MSTPAAGDRPPGVGDIGPQALSDAARARPETTRLLERDAPMSQLEAALMAARDGRGHVVSVEGEAGIGKTSLALGFVAAQRRAAQVHVGGCEHLATPESLGPLRDIAYASKGRFSVSPRSQLATFEALLRLLTTGPGPGLLLIEDIHWADDATLDLFRYLGRRIQTAPVLAVATFRNDEPPSRARLAALWADMPRDCRTRIELQPLSPDAVSALAGKSGRDAREIFEATGGNPFHVTEFLAGGAAGVPHGVREATLARIAHLGEQARRALDCAAIFPRQVDQATLRLFADDAGHAGVEECMRAGMLVARGDVLAFRHELARRAVHDAISPLRRRELHAAALQLLKAREDVSASTIAHHAQQAGSAPDIVTYSLRAADEAEALGAHSETVQHLGRALEHDLWLSIGERADLLQRQAEAGEQCGAFETAMYAIDEAIAARERDADVLGLGDALRTSARLHWYHGLPDLAEQQCARALEVLRDHRESWQYAMALSAQSQLDMLAERIDQAVPRAREAMARADALGRPDIYMHALTNATAAQYSNDVAAGVPRFLDAIAEGRRRGELDSLPRLYACFVHSMTMDRRHRDLFRHLEDGVRIAAARENTPLEGYIRGARAIALLNTGRVQESIAEAEFVVYGPFPRRTLAGFNARIALARARIRTGVPEDGVLDELRAMETARRDIMRQAPLAVIDAEALWLGLPRPGALECLREAFENALAAQGQRYLLAEIAVWLTILGEPVRIPWPILRRLWPAAQALLGGDPGAAARAWGEAGCVYEQAIALSLGDDAAQREALALFDGQGALPAAARLRRQMRARGLRAVPRGPIADTRANPAGLTRRQSQVLALLAQGLSNAAIAKRLCISPKTAEHHVSAILAQLGAGSRREAVDAARRRGLLSEN